MNMEEARVKPLFITDKTTGARYELDFNRDAVRFAEARNFDTSDVRRLPNTKISELFFYAFRMHHKNLSRQQTDEILDRKGGLSAAAVGRLIDLYDQAAYANVLIVDDEAVKNSEVAEEMD